MVLGSVGVFAAPSVGGTVVSEGCVTVVVSAGSVVDGSVGTVALGSVGVTTAPPVVSDGTVGVSAGSVGTVGVVVSSDGVAVELAIVDSPTTAGVSVAGTFSSAKAVNELADANTATE